MGYESETDTFFYLSGIEGEDLSFMSFSYYPQDTQKRLQLFRKSENKTYFLYLILILH